MERSCCLFKLHLLSPPPSNSQTCIMFSIQHRNETEEILLKSAGKAVACKLRKHIWRRHTVGFVKDGDSRSILSPTTIFNHHLFQGQLLRFFLLMWLVKQTFVGPISRFHFFYCFFLTEKTHPILLNVHGEKNQFKQSFSLSLRCYVEDNPCLIFPE